MENSLTTRAASRARQNGGHMSIENTHIGAAGIHKMLMCVEATGGSVYFIGIGGVMMSSLALLTAKRGFRVAGSDRAAGGVIDTLRAAGITVYHNHSDANLPTDCGLVVYTVAISPDNPEYLAAVKRGIPTVSRADYLGALMTRYRTRVGIAGMHGKSTCTSMCAQIYLDAHEADPMVDATILSGATYAPMGGAYRPGEGETHFLFEACEYMDSFLDLSPTVAVLLGAELEHVDYFKDMDQIRTSFFRFASLTGPNGVTVVNFDDDDVMLCGRLALESGNTGRVVTFSRAGDPRADFYAVDTRLEAGLPVFTLVAFGYAWGEVRMQVPGAHQVANALAAAAAMWAAELPPAAILTGLAHYIGAGRRMERRGKVGGAVVYDDYGHHPTEIRATLEGARALCAVGGRLICVYQPHTYSRTSALYGDFLHCFDAADRVLLLDIYAAREVNTYGVSSAALAADLGERDGVPVGAYCPSPEAAVDRIREEATPGDIVVVMGAGDVIRVTSLLFPDNTAHP